MSVPQTSLKKHNNNKACNILIRFTCSHSILLDGQMDMDTVDTKTPEQLIDMHACRSLCTAGEMT